MSRGAKQNMGEENWYKVLTRGSRQEALNWQRTHSPCQCESCLIKNVNVSSGPLRGTHHVNLHAMLLSISQGFFPLHSIPLTACRGAGSDQLLEKQQLGTRLCIYIVCTRTHAHTYTGVWLYKWAETAGVGTGGETSLREKSALFTWIQKVSSVAIRSSWFVRSISGSVGHLTPPHHLSCTAINRKQTGFLHFLHNRKNHHWTNSSKTNTTRQALVCLNI